MIPKSPLVALLNNLTAPAVGAMGVIAGDIEGGNWLKRIGVFASDHFIYEARDNDLVVNTDAMFHGARRDVAGYVFDQGADVSHFNYFRNPRTRAALVELALRRRPGSRPPTFHELVAGEFEPVPMLRSMQTRAGADQPIVFVLPGIMGSHLNIGDREVWMHYLALLRGGLGDLADVNATNVRPVALVGDGYRELCEFLQNSHEVIPFAYDWRRSVTDAARLLAVEVDNALRRTRQPVRIVAHSMGGLVVRAMIAERPDLWDRICERDGARLVMLGTPNRGSHDIVEALLGTSATVQQLALLDLHARHHRDRRTSSRSSPGCSSCCPTTDNATTSTRPNGAIPRTAPRVGRPRSRRLLTAASQTHDSLDPDTAVFPHSDRVHYVAGTSPRTVTGVEIVDGRVVLSVHDRRRRPGHLPVGPPAGRTDVVHGRGAWRLGVPPTGPSRAAGSSRHRHHVTAVDRPAQHGPRRCGRATGRSPSRCSIRRRRRWRPASSARRHAGRTGKASSRASACRWSTAICATRAIRSWSGTTKVTPSSARRPTWTG